VSYNIIEGVRLALKDMTLPEVEESIRVIQEWMAQDNEVKEERISDTSYTVPEELLHDTARHEAEQAAMKKLLTVLEERRERLRGPYAGQV
jgi:hypothetical protein